MYHQEWLLPNWEFAPKPSNAAKRRGRSKPTEHKEVKEDTTSIQLSIFDQPTNPPSFTLEFPAIVRKLTCLDKLSFLSLVTPVAKLSKMSGQDSTSLELVYLPYWNEFCKAMSECLSLPTKTDFAASDSTLSHGSQTAVGVKFWFSTTTYLALSEKCWKMFLPSSMSSDARFMDLENTSKKLKKTLTYRVYPKGETKKVWMLRIHAYRKVYNNAIAYLNKHQGFEYFNKSGKKTGGKTAFRSFCKTLGEEIIPAWCKDLKIAHALDNALFEAYTAWSKTKRQQKFFGTGSDKKPNPIAGLKIAKFRSIRDQKQTIQFDPGNYDDGHFMSVASKGLEKPEYWGQDYCLINFDFATELTYNKGKMVC